MTLCLIQRLFKIQTIGVSLHGIVTKISIITTEASLQVKAMLILNSRFNKTTFLPPPPQPPSYILTFSILVMSTLIAKHIPSEKPPHYSSMELPDKISSSNLESPPQTDFSCVANDSPPPSAPEPEAEPTSQRKNLMRKFDARCWVIGRRRR